MTFSCGSAYRYESYPPWFAREGSCVGRMQNGWHSNLLKSAGRPCLPVEDEGLSGHTPC